MTVTIMVSICPLLIFCVFSYAYGCPRPGFYGENCSLRCPVNCRTVYCHLETGACQVCKPGYKGHQCEQECGDNLYRPDCKQTCGKCREGKQCHHVSGSCNDDCEPGYQGNKCDEGSIGWRGKNCLDVDNELQEEKTGNNWETMFYGVLGAFCVTLVVVGVLVFVLYKRHQLARDIIKKYQASESSPNFKRERVAQGHVNENLNSEYQELGELSPSSTYASLQ